MYDDMGNLIAVHNEQISNLQKVLELGGWPAPSIAITNSDFDYNKFGEISFLFNAESVDPSQNSNNLIYEADAYSARFPKILYKYDADKINKMFGTNLWQSEIDNIGQYDPDLTFKQVSEYVPNSKLEYLREHLSECVAKKGVAKTNDILKRSNVVKKFESITEDYNINTIHRAMKPGKGKEQTSSFSTMSSWKAQLSKKIVTFSDIDSDKIVSYNEVQPLYENCEQEFKDLCDNLRNKCVYENCNSVDVGKGLNKIKLSYSKTKIYKIFEDYNINDDDVQRIKNLAKQVSDLPVSYMEAKPDRSIAFNSEVKAIIIPKDNEKVKDLLDVYFSKETSDVRNGIKVYEYDDNFTRKDCVNQAIADNPNLSIMEVNKDLEQSLEDKLNFVEKNITKNKNRSDIIIEK